MEGSDNHAYRRLSESYRRPFVRIHRLNAQMQPRNSVPLGPLDWHNQTLTPNPGHVFQARPEALEIVCRPSLIDVEMHTPETLRDLLYRSKQPRKLKS
jgi:hypothetical protein